LLTGLTSLYSYWALVANYKKDDVIFDNEGLLWGCILASLVTRKASFEAY